MEDAKNWTKNMRIIEPYCSMRTPELEKIAGIAKKGEGDEKEGEKGEKEGDEAAAGDDKKTGEGGNQQGTTGNTNNPTTNHGGNHHGGGSNTHHSNHHHGHHGHHGNHHGHHGGNLPLTIKRFVYKWRFFFLFFVNFLRIYANHIIHMNLTERTCVCFLSFFVNQEIICLFSFFKKMKFSNSPPCERKEFVQLSK